MTTDPTENLSSRRAGAEDDDEEERADAKLRQLQVPVLQEKRLRVEKMIKDGLPDRGKKLCALLDAVCRELARCASLDEAPHPRGGPIGARAKVEKGRGIVVRSRGAESEANLSSYTYSMPVILIVCWLCILVVFISYTYGCCLKYKIWKQICSFIVWALCFSLVICILYYRIARITQQLSSYSFLFSQDVETFYLKYKTMFREKD